MEVQEAGIHLHLPAVRGVVTEVRQALRNIIVTIMEATEQGIQAAVLVVQEVVMGRTVVLKLVRVQSILLVYITLITRSVQMDTTMDTTLA